MKDFEISVNQTPGNISFNFAEIKTELEIQMTAYSSLVITEDGQTEAKKDLATLRKIRKAFDDRRKQVKGEFMKPYDEFEVKAKELLAVIDKPINLIDSKLKDFEADRIAKKQAHLRELYDANINGLETYLPFETLKRPQWDNKSVDDKAIICDIQEQVVKVQSDLSAIKALQSEVEDECLRAYKAAGNNLAAAIQKNSDYLNAKKRAEENLRAEQERKAREDVLDSVFEWNDKKAAEAYKSTRETVPVRETENNSPNEEVYTIRVFSETALDDIREFCEFNEIRYEVM